MKRYKIWDDGAEKDIEAEDMADAEEQARDWLSEGEWGEIVETSWVHAQVAELDDEGNEIDRSAVTLTLHPEEPECADGHDHEWISPYALLGGCRENPGVWGHGGGVVIHEVCRHCGTERITDTWAQDPSNGVEGLESVSYESGKYAAEVAALASETN